MTDEVRNELRPLAWNADILTKDNDGYSGREMYGESTLALTVSSRDEAAVLVHLADKTLNAKLRYDSLGKKFVVY